MLKPFRLLAALLGLACAKVPPVTPSPESSPPTTLAADATTAAQAPPTAEPDSSPLSLLEGKSLAAAVNPFALDVWAQVRKTPGNLVVSPASIWMALAMTEAGARAETDAEMTKVLHLGANAVALRSLAGRKVRAWNMPQPNLTFRVVNRLFGEKTYAFLPPFLADLRGTFGAPLETLDFKENPGPSRERINTWVAAATEDRIRDLLPAPAVTKDTRLVLVNAVYLLMKWASSFDKTLTANAPFLVDGKVPAQVPMMHQTQTLGYAEVGGAKVLELPCRGGQLAMRFVLPADPAGLPALEQRLDAATLATFATALAKTSVSVTLPRFTLAPPRSLALRPILEALGMRRAFDADVADFSGMAQPELGTRLVIANVYHKAFVKVDEEGAEAAAVTGPRGAAASPTPEFRADHPFLFLIVDARSGLVLFIGRVDDPR